MLRKGVLGLLLFCAGSMQGEPLVKSHTIKKDKIILHVEVAEPTEVREADCAAVARYFEQLYDIPKGLLLAIAKVESNCRPWAVNHRSKSCYFSTLDEAEQYIAQLDFRSNPSISIGCMQINWRVHNIQFASLKEALMPYRNIQFAALLLVGLYQRFGSWEKAVAWYNPMGTKPNMIYKNKVWRSWRNLKTA